MKQLLDILIIFFLRFFEILIWIIKLLFPEKRKTEYDADFIHADEVLSRFNKGFCLDGRRSLTIEDSCKNCLITGSTGNFKSSGILIPSILKMRGYCSFVINDPSSELLHKTSGALIAAGYSIKTLNYASPNKSVGYNPLHRATSASDIKKISKILVGQSLGTNAKDPFWNLACENLISLISQFLLHHTEKEYHTFFNVYLLISRMSYDPKAIDMLFVKANNPALLSEYKSLLSYGDKTLASIIATARTALSIFGTDPSVALVTSHDNIDFASFRNQKTALFINNSVPDMRYYSPITSVFLEQFFGHVMSTYISKKKLPLFFLIDEASSLYFNSLQITIANIRKSFSGIMNIYQSSSQIIDLYSAPVARAITENSFGRVYMAGQNIQTAQELEITLGKFEYLNEKNIKHTRSLMTASEIRELKESIIFCGNARAVKSKTLPYFKSYGLSQLSKLKPYEPQYDLPFPVPPHLNINTNG